MKKNYFKSIAAAAVIALSAIGLPVSSYADEPAAKIGNISYATLQAAFNAVAEGETIELTAGEISETEIKLPNSMKNVTLKGADNHSSILKDTELSMKNGSYDIDGFTVEGVVFNGSRFQCVVWDNTSSLKNFTFTNNVFKNVYDETNVAAIHFNVSIDNCPVNGLVLTENSFDSITGASKSGVYASVTGNVTATGNKINNVAFRPLLFMVNDKDTIEDNVIVTDNTFSGSTQGRMQVSGTEIGTDSGTIKITDNIFKDINNAQQICVWNINEEKVTVDFSGNYFDQKDKARIYWNDMGNVFIAGEKAKDLPHGSSESFYYYTGLTDGEKIDVTTKYEPSTGFDVESGVWHISTPAGWVKFVENVNSGTDYKGVTVVLDNDLDMTGLTVLPAGSHTNAKSFKGNFDGQDKTISNINIQNIPGKLGVGLFGKTYMATIKNLNVKNAVVTGLNADNTKSVAYVGGIVGHGYATIDNCSFSGSIYAGHQIGGIAGSGAFTITNCTFDGAINSTRFWAFGGIIGNAQEETKLVGNTAKGSITIVCDNVLESYKGKYTIGGIAGAPYSNKQVIQNNYSAIKLTFNGKEILNPVVGMYNDSDNHAMGDDFSSVSGNTWDKAVYNVDSFKIALFDAGETDWVSEYGGNTVKEVKTLESNSLVLRNLSPIEKDGKTIYRLAFFAAVDKLDYDNVGFKLTIDGESKEISTNKVFTSVTYNSTNSQTAAKTVTAKDFDIDGKTTENKYIFGLIEGFTEEYITKSFSAIPFAVDTDGNYIWGIEVNGDYIYQQ